MTFSIRRALLTSGCLLAAFALAPVACSSKAPQTEPVIGGGCTADGECTPDQHCENGACVADCIPANNNCPSGTTCSDGRCTSSGTGGTGAGGSGGGTAGSIHIEAGPETSTDDGSLNPDAACGTGSATAMLVPVSMFVMFDRSGSMIQNQQPPTRWDNAALALTTFFKDPGAADLAIALRFFPHDQPAVGCTNSAMTGCIAADCQQPLVPLMADPMMLLPKLTADPEPMDTHEAALVAAVAASVPMTGGANMGGGTPTSVALQGAVDWAAAYQTAHPRPQQQTVVVFVTDGQPNGCEEDRAAISMIAANALSGPAGISTYVVGLTNNAQDLAFLEDLAVAGGTAPAFIVLDGATAAMDLVTTLKEIQGSALDCNFPFPTVATDGGMADPTRINVDYTPGGVAGTTPVQFFRVETAADCPLDQPAWYYDNPMAPTEIILCPTACTTVTADTAAKLDIQIGCDSRPPPET